MDLFMTIWHITGTVFSIAFGVFILWMLIDCIINVDDKEDRFIWVLLIVLFGALFAPVYFAQRFLPRRKHLKKELNRDT